MKTLFSTLFLFFIAATVFSQDLIVKNSGDTIKCKVTELAAEQVKYYYVDNEKLIFGIDNALVDHIKFSTGEIVELDKNSLENLEYYAKQHKNALKVNFLSPLFGSTAFTFEHSIKPGRSWEATLGIIGLGNDAFGYDPSGVYGKFAYKLTRSPDFYLNRMRYSHILKGAYIAPEIALRYMSYDDDYYWDSEEYSDDDETQFTAAFMLKFGKQWVFDDAFLVDTFFGVGYALGTDDCESLPYGFLSCNSDFPIALSWGIRVGWVFGKKYQFEF